MYRNKIILGYDKATGKTYRGMPEWAKGLHKDDITECLHLSHDIIDKLSDDLLPDVEWAERNDDICAWHEHVTDDGETIRVYRNRVEFDGEEVWPGKEYGPATSVTGEIGGKFGFQSHDPANKRHETRVVEDLAHDLGRKYWKDYEQYVDNDGVHHEGPSPRSVANKEDFQSYLKLTGQSVSERGQTVTSPLERLREKVRRHRR